MTFEFTEAQINYILEVLADRPYRECFSVIQEIHRQANNQPEPKEE